MTGYTDPYSGTSRIYDLTSRYVPYDEWAKHIKLLVRVYQRRPAESVLELSAGTGSFRTFFNLAEIKTYIIGDISLGMLQGSLLKTEDSGVSMLPVCFDNGSIPFKSDSFDLAIMLFDSINYNTEPAKVSQVVTGILGCLRTNGIFIFDFTTPVNSLSNSPEDFSEQFEEVDASFIRVSKYDPETQIHVTEFKITDGDRIFTEQHVERTYTIQEMKEILQKIPGCEIMSMLHEFESGKKAGPKTERVHVIIRKR